MSKHQVIRIDPLVIRFTHARIRPYFTGCGMRIEDTISQLLSGETKLSDLPLITVIENDGEYYSLNNRRLYVLKTLRNLGKLEENQVECVWKEALERERKRYTPINCCLTARIMRENNKEEGKYSHEELKEILVFKDQKLPTKFVLCEEVKRNMKNLQALAKKGKNKAIHSQLDEWLTDGVMNREQIQELCDELRIPYN